MDLLAELRTRRALCIVRAPSIPDPAGLAGTLVEAGLPIVEFSFTTPDAARLIEQASHVDGVVMGAGTVLTVQQARDATAAGARFLLTPGIQLEVAEEANRQGVPILLGAMTPTEVADAIRAGSTAVKVFPAARLGPGYIKDLLGPYPDAALVVSGGIHAGNAADYLAAGAIAATAGSGVVSPELATGSRFAEIRLRAAEFLAAVRKES
jgi:2-dehydro-3-deoxyphosphogluconate aldolase/(4S)-4-hydroxy-2-oxoglutarate aldolase